MSRCTDRALGHLLHDYELGFLSDEDRQRFELHLYDCDYCLKECRSFSHVTNIMRTDLEIRRVVSEEAINGQARGRLSSTYKYLLVAALVCILAIPLYWFTNGDEVSQTVDLLAIRSGGQTIIYLDEGGDVQINFQAQRHSHDALILLITNISGDTVLYDSSFEDVNAEGFGTLVLPVRTFTEGHYILTLSDQGDSAVDRQIQHMFRVK